MYQDSLPVRLHNSTWPVVVEVDWRLASRIRIVFVLLEIRGQTSATIPTSLRLVCQPCNMYLTVAFTNSLQSVQDFTNKTGKQRQDAGSSSKSGDTTKISATLGNNGIGKSKLLSKAARNPYATYSSSCTTCKTKVDQGRTYCHKCAYKANACAMCGKASSKSTTAAPVIAGQKFTLK
ncbi:hypothetical protein WAI453_013675 [Rhynchosporium graminicola]